MFDFSVVPMSCGPSSLVILIADFDLIDLAAFDFCFLLFR
jgi:hypothetical protein